MDLAFTHFHIHLVLHQPGGRRSRSLFASENQRKDALLASSLRFVGFFMVLGRQLSIRRWEHRSSLDRVDSLECQRSLHWKEDAMSFQIRFLVGSCFLFLVIYGFYNAQGDPPKVLQLPNVELAPVPMPEPDGQVEQEDSQAFQAIRAAVEGKLPEKAVNDPILGDVMQAIAERHRELGLDLDWDQEAGPTSTTEGVAAGGAQRAQITANAKAAEQLLKASRLLENVSKITGETAGSSRTDLVNRMRAEAVKLLSE